MPTTSTLEMAILGLLKQKAQSGYDLRKTFATTAMRHYSDSPGSIYPALRRMEMRGWVESVKVRDGGAPRSRRRAFMLTGPREVALGARRRQEFALTLHGVGNLHAWLLENVTREDVMFRLGELLLRFAFMDGNISRSMTVRFLDQLSSELDQYVGELRTQFKQASAGAPLHTGLLAFDLGIRSMETQLAWAREARARLKETMP